MREEYGGYSGGVIVIVNKGETPGNLPAIFTQG